MSRSLGEIFFEQCKSLNDINSVFYYYKVNFHRGLDYKPNVVILNSCTGDPTTDEKQKQSTLKTLGTH